jgi:hypothetical protein
VTPVTNNSFRNAIQVIGAPPMSPRDTAVVNYVTAGWFATYGTPLRAGRDLSAADAKDAQPVAVVNEAFANRFLSGRDPLGSYVAFANGGVVQRGMSIVGVADDAVFRTVREAAPPTIYVPISQAVLPFPLSGISISARARADVPERLTREIAAALTAVDPNLSFNFRTVADAVNASLRQERIVALLSGLFAGLAVLLAAIGVFGVASHAVSRRYREIGIRMALGARSSGVVLHVMARMLALVGAGIAAGAVVALWLSRFVVTLLYGVEPRDPATLTGSALLLIGIAAAAAAVPAWRATRIDPAVVLRDD